MDRKNKIALLEIRLDPLYKRLENCDICPRECKVNRLAGQKGYCNTDNNIVVYTTFLHHGEEPLISGDKGSGTIFFSGCNLKCIYCQNHKFSHSIKGKVIDEIGLAEVMLDLQQKEAHNINLVTPTHFLPQILKGLLIALKEGLNIPIVYNTSGYEKKEIIEQLKGIVDIYLTDIKYISSTLAQTCSNALNYSIFCCETVKSMSNQSEKIFDNNILRNGLVIRHLVLPNHIDESKEILSWIKNYTPEALVSVMFQYKPYFRAQLYPPINRLINISEYKEIKDFIETLELNGWVQEFNPPDDLAGVHFTPELEI